MSGDELGISGMNSAVADAVDTSVSPPDHLSGEQLPLLPLRNAQGAAAERGEDGSAGRGVGRPKGSKNKSTKDWTDFLLRQYASPLQVLAEMYSRSLPELHRELMEHCGVSDPTKTRMTYPQAIELLKIQLGAAKELAPYLHQKQPMALQSGEGGLINLFIGTECAGAIHSEEATNFDFEILDVENEENQQLSNRENQEFNGEQSNDLPQSGGNSDNSTLQPSD